MVSAILDCGIDDDASGKIPFPKSVNSLLILALDLVYDGKMIPL